MPISKEFKADLDRLSELIKTYEGLLKKEPGSRLDTCFVSIQYEGTTWELFYDHPNLMIIEEAHTPKRLEDLTTSERIEVCSHLPSLLRQAKKCNNDLHSYLKEVLVDLEQFISTESQ